MAIGSRNTCTSCFGNGRCPQCEGSGFDLNHGDDPRKCGSCSGTGTRSACNGSGAWMQPPTEIFDRGVRQSVLGGAALRRCD